MTHIYDGTFGNKRPMNIEWLAEMARLIRIEYEATAFISFGVCEASIQVRPSGLLEIAPVADWTWRDRKDDTCPHGAAAMRHGVKFFSVFTDEEKDAVLATA